MRYELKYLIPPALQHLLMRQLENIMTYDRFSGSDGYIISSLYFDDPQFSAYNEKIEGVSDRAKYRIRVYDYSDKVIKLEKKKRTSGFIEKQIKTLSRESYEDMLKGNYRALLNNAEPLSRQLYANFTLSRLIPAVVVEYRRIAFIDTIGTRVTFDTDLKASVSRHDLFSGDTVLLDAGERGMTVMEVKFSGVLPQAIKTILNQSNTQLLSISKYAMCMEKRFEVGKR